MWLDVTERKMQCLYPFIPSYTFIPFIGEQFEIGIEVYCEQLSNE